LKKISQIKLGLLALSPVYTWCTLTGVKLNNNRIQYQSTPRNFLAM